MKYRKKFITRFLIINIILAIAIIVPVKLKEKKLEEYNIEKQAEFKYQIGVLNEIGLAKENVLKIYGQEQEINKLKEEINTVSSNINLTIDENVGQLVSNITKKISDISISNIKELEKTFNEIHDSIKDNFSEEIDNQINDLINEYHSYLEDGNYIKAKEILTSFQTVVSEKLKVYEAERIKREYDVNSSENPSNREPYYKNGVLLVNKLHGLPDTYAPGEDYEAREAFEKMKVDAANEGIYLYSFSVYRNYWYQNRLYSNYVYSYGQDPTDTFSARPGFSEHQTGLAFDIGGVDRNLWGEEGFRYTAEAEWLRNNAHNYGFILRYPEGKEWKTGYMYESWHYRYVGVEHSKNFANNNLTLEEYLGE